MPGMASSVRDIYITGLRNAHALEAQADQLISRQVERLENYPELSQRMRLHLEETRNQAKRLEQILSHHGTSESTLKDMATGFMGNMAAMAHAVTQDEVVKNSFANYAFEHFEIASYRALIEMSQAAGDSAAMPLLQESLREEMAMAQWLEQNLSPTVHRYIERETRGQTAGV